MTSNLILSLLLLSFEDHFRFFMLLLSKYLNRSRNKFFDLNTVKVETVKNQSKVSNSDSATLSLVIVVPWLLLQTCDRVFLIESYLYSSFCFNISITVFISNNSERFLFNCSRGLPFSNF